MTASKRGGKKDGKKQSKKKRGKATKTRENVPPVVEDEAEELSDRNDGDDLGEPSEECQPLPPDNLWFENTEFTKKCKIQSRCNVSKTVEVIETLENELPWFKNHPQFSHFFHMPREPNLKLLGMWILLLRTVPLDEEEGTAWFAVNGVPIRYSMREHAFISGMECHEYPANYERLGSFEFVDRHFKTHKEITMKSVEAKLLSMRSCGDRLKMAVLFFLGTIIRGNGKFNGRFDSFILRVVNDLEVCQTFPWGRLTFEDALHSINHVMKHLKGKPKSSVNFPGFIIPLEVLIFESIPALGAKFREGIPGCMSSCPRMCKRRFQNNSMKGYPLEELYNALGNTKEINSYLVPNDNEAPLMARIVSEEPDYDTEDGVSAFWNSWLITKEKPIWWKGLYELDVAAREFPQKKEKEKVVTEERASSNNAVEDVLKGFEERILNSLNEVNVKMETMDNQLDEIEKSQRYLANKYKKMKGVKKRVDAIENGQYFLRKRGRKQDLMEKKLDAIEKQLKEKETFNNEGFENQGMDFHWTDEEKDGEEPEAREKEEAEKKEAEKEEAEKEEAEKEEKEKEEAEKEEAEKQEDTVDGEVPDTAEKEEKEETEKEKDTAEKEENETEKEKKAEKEAEKEKENETEKEPVKKETLEKEENEKDEAEKEKTEMENETEKEIEKEAEEEAEVEAEAEAEEGAEKYTEEEKAGWLLTIYTGGNEGTPVPPTPDVVTNRPRGRPRAMAVRKTPPRKRGRPRKADKPEKFTTPLPEKRARAPSQWVSSPFTEGNTAEIEGPKKKPKTNA